MRATAYATLVFFVSLNLSLYLLNASELLPNYQQSPYEDPEGIQQQFRFIDVTGYSVISGAAIIGVGFLVGWLLGRILLGATLGIIVFALTLLAPIIQWILFGFPVFLGQIGVPAIVVVIVETLMALVWFWFILGYIAQRTTWEQ